MNEDAVRGAAKLLADAWRDMTTIEGLPPALRPGSFEEAYAIQDEMAALIGQKTVGWKIGPASPGLMRAEGFDEPGVGRLFEPNIYRSPAELPHGHITDAKLECEFALRLSADVTPRDKAYTAEELAPLAVLCLAFEVSGCRFSTPRAVAKASSRTSDMPSPLDLLADNGSGAALVVGDEIPEWQHLDLQTFRSICASMAAHPSRTSRAMIAAIRRRCWSGLPTSCPGGGSACAQAIWWQPARPRMTSCSMLVLRPSLTLAIWENFG